MELYFSLKGCTSDCGPIQLCLKKNVTEERGEIGIETIYSNVNVIG